MSRKGDHCASCGKQRGDGRDDRGWKYFWWKWKGGSFDLQLVFCPDCATYLDTPKSTGGVS